MVLCKFFQQGTCRFGSKCANEHLDIKHVVKTDVESAINGKQWPLSCYGPFRDKTSIPNFIEDQSFEEVRMLCYESKQKSFFDQFHQQFLKEVMEAKNKMNALLQMTPDVVEVLTKLYDAPSDANSFGIAAGKSTNNASNPFGLGNSSSNPGSIFANSSNNAASNNLFANKNALGGSNQGATGLFSNASVFAQQQQTSVFAQVPKTTNSIFSVGNNTTNASNTSIFAQQQNPSNIFAASAQQQQATASNGLFSQQNQFMQQSSNIFRQALQPAQPPQQGLFAQAAQSMQQQQLVQPQPGLFAQAAQQTPAGQNLFATATQQTQNIFSQAMQQQNMFQQTQPNINSQQQQQQVTSNIFQQNQPITNPPQIQSHQPSAGVFQQAALQTHTQTGQTNNLAQPTTSTLYSRLEDLTPDEIEAFKADCFLPGRIPFNPSPRELIN